MFKSIQTAQLVGQCKWEDLLELLDEKEYTILAYAHEQLGHIDKAKSYYLLALDEDKENLVAIQQLSMLYAAEENHTKTYKYIQRGLILAKYKKNYGLKFFNFFIDIMIKIRYPSKSFNVIRSDSKEDIESLNNWIKWAHEYENWYRNNYLI